MTTEVPVWWNGRERWVTDVTRKTTCDDVISALVGQRAHGFTIMERWGRVERPLDGQAKILRVWSAWGDAQAEVRLTLRRRDGERSRRRHHKRPCGQTLHPRRLIQLQDHQSIPESIEKLMKLILVQGETIQNQLKRLQDREHQIEHLEDETHRARVEVLGSNYLLETYLGKSPLEGDEGEVKEDDSGVVTEGGSGQASPETCAGNSSGAVIHALQDDEDEGNIADESDNETTKDHPIVDDAALLELQARVELWENLVKINKRLEREEECLVRLHVKLRRYQNKYAIQEEADEEEEQAREALVQEVDRARAELQKGSRELEQNAIALAESDALLDARRCYLRRLQIELESCDRETERLQQLVQKVHTEQMAATKRKVAADADSNSDTGLSSLHSGSEEGVYLLDTLV